MQRAKSYHKNRESGFVLIAVILLLVILVIVAAAALLTSRTQVNLSGDFKSKTSCYYMNEEALNRTLYFFINPSVDTNMQTRIATLEGHPYRGKMTCNLNQTTRLWEPVRVDSGADVSSMNCDFLEGASQALEGQSAEVRVMVSRKQDHCKDGGFTDAAKTSCEGLNPIDATDGQVYLANSVCTDTQGRQEVLQGVIVVPILKRLTAQAGSQTLIAQNARHPYLVPYLASVVKGVEHIPFVPSPTTTISIKSLPTGGAE